MSPELQADSLPSEPLGKPNNYYWNSINWGDFAGDSGGKLSTCNAGNPGSISGLGRSSGEGNGDPLLYSCLENSTDRGVHGIAESDMTEQLTHTTL